MEKIVYRVLILISFTLSLTILEAEKMTVLIAPFSDNSLEKSSKGLELLISDSIKLEIGSYEQFKPLSVSSLEEYRPGNSEQLYRIAFDRKADLILTGSYIESGGEVAITFVVIDVLTNRRKIVEYALGRWEEDLFETVRYSVRRLLEIMSAEISPYARDQSEKMRRKQERLLRGLRRELFFTLELGIIYYSRVLSALDRTAGLQLDASENELVNHDGRYSFSLPSPKFRVEVYGKYKKHLLGAMINLAAPSFSLLNHNRWGGALDFSLGLRGELFFYWGFSYFGEYSWRGYFHNFLGVNFIFKYQPFKYPFFIEGGVIFIPSFGNFILPQGELPRVTINTVRILGYTSSKTFLFPLLFNLRGGVFPGKNYGIFWDFEVSFSRYDYYDKARWVIIGREDDEYVYMGSDFIFDFHITCGMVFRTAFN